MKPSRYLTLLAVAMLSGAPAYAWDWYHPSVEVEFKESSVVCVGSLSETKKIFDKDGFNSGTFYMVRVVEMLKGAPATTIELYCDNDSGRFEIDPGHKYLIFAYYDEHFDGVSGRHLTINDGGNYGSLPRADKTLAVVRGLLAAHQK